jgi:aminomuconate-semialdehyde/2-hydroxymuconate-6-semialdehyde dehydrogenase
MSNATVASSLNLDLKKIEHFIGGKFQAGSGKETFESINPATGKAHATVALGTADDIDAAVKAARHAFEKGPWPRMSVRERCNILRKIADLILARREEFAIAESIDTGKPISESFDGDIPRSAFNFQFFADFAPSYVEETFSSAENERHIAVREPLGVCGLITPWNLPLYLATWKIAPALAMGNTIVLKPAEWTPYTAYLLAQVAVLAGLPDGVLNIVQGFGAGGAGEALTRHPDVRSISFTGETSTGRAIMQAASATMKKLSFELGGKGCQHHFC